MVQVMMIKNRQAPLADLDVGGSFAAVPDPADRGGHERGGPVFFMPCGEDHHPFRQPEIRGICRKANQEEVV